MPCCQRQAKATKSLLNRNIDMSSDYYNANSIPQTSLRRYINEQNVDKIGETRHYQGFYRDLNVQPKILPDKITNLR